MIAKHPVAIENEIDVPVLESYGHVDTTLDVGCGKDTSGEIGQIVGSLVMTFLNY